MLLRKDGQEGNTEYSSNGNVEQKSECNSESDIEQNVKYNSKVDAEQIAAYNSNVITESDMHLSSKADIEQATNTYWSLVQYEYDLQGNRITEKRYQEEQSAV